MRGRADVGTSAAATAGGPAQLKLQDIEAAVAKLRGIPPVKWMLVAPDGRVWSDADPLVLGRVCAAAGYGLSSPNGATPGLGDASDPTAKTHDYPACAIYRGGKCTCD